MRDEFIWVEKYRPKTIGDCILPENTKKTFKEFLVKGEIPNLLLAGPPGIGKTTVAKALCAELGVDCYVINGSDEGRFLDTVRNQAKNFASTVSLMDADRKHKVIIIDEADNTTHDVQLLLRANIESFYKNCRFIFTCNFKNRIIEPLHSRCGVYEFNTSKKDMAELCTLFMERAKDILEKENIKCDNKALANLIMKFAPDWRRILNELQRYSVNGAIDIGITNALDDKNYDDLFKFLKSKDFKKMRNWVVNNIDTDVSAIFRSVYDRMQDKVSPQSIPQLVLILADYQYKNAFVADHELNVVACLTEVMSDVQFN